MHESAVWTLIDFLNCDNYPPFSFVSVDDGGANNRSPLRCLKRFRGSVAELFITVGRVPVFFYLLHIFLLRVLAVVAVYQTISSPESLVGSQKPLTHTNGYGFGLPVVYAVWLGVCFALYPVCRWYAGIKRRSRSALLSWL